MVELWIQNGPWTLSNHWCWAGSLSPLRYAAFSRFEYEVFYSQVIGRLEWVPLGKNKDAILTSISEGVLESLGTYSRIT